MNIFYLFYQLEHKDIRKFINDGSRSKLNQADLLNIPVFITSLKEEEKIGNFFQLLDKRIIILSNKIETLKKYRKGLMQKVLKLFTLCKFISLDKTCKVTTGKLDANAQIDNGKYKFFTCSKEDLLIDTYAFDMEAILVSGNGEVGLAKYYKGKFNAYQRTYVLYDFLLNPLFIKICIDSQINNVIRKETNKGAMPYIKLTTFSKVNIPMITKKESDKIGNLVSVIDCKIKCYEQIAAEISKFKSFCLNNMFI